MKSFARLSLVLIFVCLSLAVEERAGAQEWQPIGLLRSRDLTPFGILRLDLLPAQAAAAPPGTWGLEVDMAYQNTYVLSANVRYYLQNQRSGGRAALTRRDVNAILALPGDAYFVDTEVGLMDLGFHYSVDPHWEVELNLPLLHYGGGFLDSTIEGFHSTFGFSNTDRDLVARNSSQYVVKVGGLRIVELAPPRENGLGDPALGARYALIPHPGPWNLVFEGAIKLPVGGTRAFLSDGRTDVGLQATLQRFFRHQALYVELSAIRAGGLDGSERSNYQVIPTLLLGYERRLTARTNGILQFYVGGSEIEKSTLKDLTKDKYQVSLGLQTARGATIYRMALTENVGHFGNTPDVAFLLGVAHAVAPSKHSGN
jgi:hypothetical protein